MDEIRKVLKELSDDIKIALGRISQSHQTDSFYVLPLLDQIRLSILKCEQLRLKLHDPLFDSRITKELLLQITSLTTEYRLTRLNHTHIPKLTKSLTQLKGSIDKVISGLDGYHRGSGRLTLEYKAKHASLSDIRTYEDLSDDLPPLRASMAIDKDRPEKNARETPVMFATTRAKRAVVRSDKISFANGRGNDSLTYGIATVSIPRNHKYSKIESPTWWKLEFREDIEKHIVITKCVERTLSQWDTAAIDRIVETETNAALVFIHGYNVTFDDAIKTAAQIGYDMQFKGLITAFDWSSEGSVQGYLADADHAELAVPALQAYLSHLKADLNIKTIHVIAHSMGNRVFLNALKDTPPSETPILEQAIFAAPDVDATIFKNNFPKLLGKAKGYTLYGSSHDLPIHAAGLIRGHIRAGDGGDNLLVIKDLISIDASAVGENVFGLGHSYFAGLRAVLTDINFLINQATHPSQRPTLIPHFKENLPYWVIAR